VQLGLRQNPPLHTMDVGQSVLLVQELLHEGTGVGVGVGVGVGLA
jgi:hypothetical protein